VKFLIDQNRSPRLAQLLRDAGHDAVHTLDLGLEGAEDDDLLPIAAEQGRIVITGDTDFGALLALARRRSPSSMVDQGGERPRTCVDVRVRCDSRHEVSALGTASAPQQLRSPAWPRVQLVPAGESC
jgi:hypothetical protein